MAIRALFFVDVPHRLAGAQRSLLAAVRELASHGVVARVVFPAEGMCVDAFRAADVPTTVLPAPVALLTFGKKLLGIGMLERAAVLIRDVLPYSRALARLARDEGADVFHFNTPRGILAAGIAARLARRPAVLHLRGAVPFGGTYWAAAQALANRIILVAHALESEVAPRYRARCRVVYNGVTAPPRLDRGAARRELAARLGLGSEALGDDTMVFLSLSSLAPFKGLHHLVEAAAQARAAGVRGRYVLAGSGEDERYASWLERERRRLGLDDIVHMCGFVADPLPLLGAADALVLPSVERELLALDDGTPIDVRGNEGLPRSILEALANGLPVVASRIAGVAEQIDDGVTGVLVAPGDSAALARALVRVAGDLRFRHTATTRGPEVVAQRFSVDAAARGLAAVLMEAAGDQARRSR